MNEFITIAESIKITGKSKSTIRRFVQAHIDNNTIIRQETNNRNRPLYKINKAFLLSYYSINIGTNSAATPKEKLESARKLLILQEQLVNQKKIFKTITISVVIVAILIFVIGIYYHHKIITKLDEELSFYIKYQTENKNTYDLSKKELKSAYSKLLNEKQKKIESLEKSISEYKTNTTVKDKQVDTLEKERDKLLNKLTVKE